MPNGETLKMLRAAYAIKRGENYWKRRFWFLME